MREGIEDGAVPKAVTTYEEESSRRAFEAGNATFMRNWPYAYALGKESGIANEFAVTKFPGFNGNPGAGVSAATTSASRPSPTTRSGSLAFAEFLVTEPVQKEMFLKATLPAVATAVYKDPEVKKEIPFTEELLKAVEQAQARPLSPVYTGNHGSHLRQRVRSAERTASAQGGDVEDGL